MIRQIVRQIQKFSECGIFATNEGRRDKALKCGIVPQNAGHLAGLQLVLVSDLLASVFSSPGGYGFRYPDRYTLLPWFLNFVFVAQKFVIYGCRKQAISHQDPAWAIHITLQYRNNIIGSTKVTLSQPSAK